MKSLRAAAFATLLLCSCCEEVAPPAPVEGAPSMAPMAHGDHEPKHDGTVWMNGDLHFEVVLRESGGLRRWAAVCVGLTGIIVMLRPG